ncbi:C40 family peptidase [Mucilaginibacter gynuensis]|uniref:C40 family peptidase n=1 Tax=Mucilaginibacter gynuensis TaxID=1302236 RepID=A0ABP8G8I4_9SPHI
MEYGICNLAVVPLRAEPNERSEQVSQVLFGEAFEILEWQEHWVQIITAYDNYKGWIARLQVNPLGHIAYKQIKNGHVPQTHRAITQAWKKADNSVLYLPVGSSLVFLEGDRCKIGHETFTIVGEIGASTNIATTAKSFLNSPYLWGGRTHLGIDCSGFTQSVFKLHDIKIDRDASQQAKQGTEVTDLKTVKLGDLAFFENKDARIIHVGIMLDQKHIIHASGRVKIELFDEKGIYSEEQKRYTHKFCIMKRYF